LYKTRVFLRTSNDLQAEKKSNQYRHNNRRYRWFWHFGINTKFVV